MRIFRVAVIAALASVSAASVLAAPALAIAGTPGGAQAPAATTAGGSQFGTPLHLLASRRPVLSALHAPATATSGVPPLVTLQLSERGVNTVYLQVKVISLATHHSALIATMGWVHTGRTLTVSWPAGAQLSPGSYELSVTCTITRASDCCAQHTARARPPSRSPRHRPRRRRAPLR